MLPPHINPHPSLQFCTNVAYRPHAPAARLIFTSDTTTPTAYHAHNFPLTLPRRVHPHPHSLPSLHSCPTLKVTMLALPH
ncbi:hypothetical protein O181_020180 [Austropuccinia psidii MF-1]|uniref:Uncharacterized protein n=1 Tax=Austropuccinia psidii MF-1 TaxID=1389203 RepID=A0A9Q3CD95_9BASI|nr:hypothetical protein [Austropuccinia psidii MF-1]